MRIYARNLGSNAGIGDSGSGSQVLPAKVETRPLRKLIDRIYLKSVDSAAKLNQKLTEKSNGLSAADLESTKLKLDRCKSTIELSLVLQKLVEPNATITEAGQISYIIDLLSSIGIDYHAAVSEKGKLQSPPKPPAPTGSSPRLPYLTYRSSDALEIRVGRSAAENDVLSCEKYFRDDQDWWFHVAGYSGSHVVIRSHCDDLPKKYPRSLREAAYLAALNSKAPRSQRTAVTCTRCKYVSKARGDPPGMVRLDRTNAVSVLVPSLDKLPEFQALLATKSYS